MNESNPIELDLEEVEQDLQQEAITRLAKRELKATTDVTRFVNIDDEPYDLRINGQIVRNILGGKEHVLPLFVATVGAKHLVDRILKKKNKNMDTNKDSPLRRSTFAQILPDLARERKIKPLTSEEEIAELKIENQKSRELIESFGKVAPEVAEMQKEIAKLKKVLESKGQTTTKK